MTLKVLALGKKSQQTVQIKHRFTCSLLKGWIDLRWDLPGSLMRGVVGRALSSENTLLLLRRLLPTSHRLSVLAASPSAHFFPFCALGTGRGWGKEGKEVCSLCVKMVSARRVLTQGNIFRRIQKSKYLNTDSPFLSI